MRADRATAVDLPAWRAQLSRRRRWLPSRTWICQGSGSRPRMRMTWVGVGRGRWGREEAVDMGRVLVGNCKLQIANCKLTRRSGGGRGGGVELEELGHAEDGEGVLAPVGFAFGEPVAEGVVACPEAVLAEVAVVDGAF